MKRLIAVMLVLGAPVQAQDLRAFDGADIARALTDRTVHYARGATQHFYASGRTLYTFGEPSWGSWRVEADRYCSQWPPAPDWSCYSVSCDGARTITFRDDVGREYSGEILPE